MDKKCIICDRDMIEMSGKLQGTAVKVREDNKNRLIYICSECQKKENWIEEAKIKSV